MISCKESRDWIPLFPDDLEANEAASAREHIASCNDCAAELGIFMAQAARFAQVRRSRGKVDLLAGIERELARPAGSIVSFPRRIVAAAAAAVLLALGLFAWSQRSTETQGPIANDAPKLVVPPRKEDPKKTEPAAKPQRRKVFEDEVAQPERRFRFRGNNLFPVIERELVPLDEEAEVPHATKKAYEEPAVAHPSNSPQTKSDEDRSLSF